jgi:HEAT repeat protein
MLAWFVVGVVAPFIRMQLVIRDFDMHRIDGPKAVELLGGPERAAQRLGRCFRMPEPPQYDYEATARLLAHCGKPAVPALVGVAETSDNPFKRLYALCALGHIGSQAAEAVPALIRMLNVRREGEDPEAVADALGGIGPGARAAVPALEKLLADDDKRIRSASARALSRIDPTVVAAVAALVEALDSDSDVEACESLGRMGSVARAALPALERKVRQWKADERLRAAAAEALKKIRGEEAGKQASPLAPPARAGTILDGSWSE